MYNKVIMMGRITRELELRTTPNGLSVTSFSIAVDRRFSSGEERKSDFFNVVAWRQQAEFVCKYFGKGRMILVEGELQTRQYADKDGVTRYVTEIIADRLSFTGESKAAASGGGAPYQGASGNYQNNYQAPAQHPAESQNAAPAMAQGSAQDFVESADDDDDYPF